MKPPFIRTGRRIAIIDGERVVIDPFKKSPKAKKYLKKAKAKYKAFIEKKKLSNA